MGRSTSGARVLIETTWAIKERGGMSDEKEREGQALALRQ